MINSGEHAPGWKAEEAATVSQWVRDGGMLILTGDAPRSLDRGAAKLGSLAALLGANTIRAVAEPATIDERFGGGRLKAEAGRWALADLTTARVLYGSPREGRVTINSLGKGRVVYVGYEPAKTKGKLLDALTDFLRRQVVESGVKLGKTTREAYVLEPLGPVVEFPLPAKPPIRHELKSNRQIHPAHGEPVTLARKGEAVATIVTRDEPSRSVDEAVAFLQHGIERLCDVRLPVVKESSVTWEKKSSRLMRGSHPLPATLIVGPTELGKELGITADGIAPEGWCIRTAPGGLLFVIGMDESPRGLACNGTRHGAVALLEGLGFRWLWPGELGEVVPARTEVVIPPVNETDAPAIGHREITNRGYRLDKRYQEGLDWIGLSGEKFLERGEQAGRNWIARQRSGRSFEVKGGHTYGGYWERFGSAHPDWFALQPTGLRTQKPERERLNKQNKELIAHIAQAKIEEIRKEPGIHAVAVSQNDGKAINQFDMSREARLLDPPNGQKELFPYIVGGVQNDKFYPSPSDRVATFYNAITERVAEVFPDYWVHGYAYSVYRSAPLYVKLHPNILTGFTGFSYLDKNRRDLDMAAWNGWAANAKQMLFRPNVLLYGHGLPSNYARRMAADMKHQFQTGMIAASYPRMPGDWAALGLNYYVVPRLLWDPSQDVDAIIDDYCKTGFCLASGAIRGYFDELEKLNADAAGESGGTHNIIADEEDDPEDAAVSTFEVFLKRAITIYTPERIARLRELLDVARKTAGGEKTVLARIDFLGKGVDYAELTAVFFRLFYAEKPDPAALKTALEKRKQFFRDCFENDFFAVGVAHWSWREDWVRKKDFTAH